MARRDVSNVGSILPGGTSSGGALTTSVDNEGRPEAIINTDEPGGVKGGAPAHGVASGRAAAERVAAGAEVAVVGDGDLLTEALGLALPRLGLAACSIEVRLGNLAEVARGLLRDGCRMAVVVISPDNISGSIQRLGILSSAGLQVLAVSSIAHPAVTKACRGAGVHCVLSTIESLDRLHGALVSVKRSLPEIAAPPGGPFGGVPDDVREAREQIATLTCREEEVLGYLLDGMATKAIASKLGVKMATARSHVAAILRKLSVSSQIQAVAVARRAGWER